MRPWRRKPTGGSLSVSGPLHHLAHNLAQGIGIEHRIGIGEDHNLCPVLTESVLHGSCLAPALGAIDKRHLRVFAEQFVGTVVGTVSDPHDAEALTRVLQLTNVLHLLKDDVLLVVGTDHQLHGRIVLAVGWQINNGLLLTKQTLQPYHQPQHHSVAHVSIDDECQADPECYLQCCHTLSDDGLTAVDDIESRLQRVSVGMNLPAVEGVNGEG